MSFTTKDFSGSSITGASDTIAGVNYAEVKLTDSTVGSTAPTGVAANPLQVSIANTGANATAVKVDNSAVTQPVSGTVTVTQGTASSLKVDLSGTGANTTALKVDGSAVTQPVSIAAVGHGTAATAVRVELPTDGTGVVGLVAGEAHIGEVAGNIGASSDAIAARSANTTSYAASQAINAVTLAVTAATNATPIVITTATHNMSTGQWVSIVGATGNTAANGTFKITVLSSTTFSLQDVNGANIAGNGAWVSGGTVAQVLVLSTMARKANGAGYINKVMLTSNSKTTVGNVRVWFYHSPPTNTSAFVDAAAFNVFFADRVIRVGYADLTLATEGAGSDMSIGVWTPGLNSIAALPFSTSGPNGELWALLEATGTIVTTSGEQFYLRVTSERY